MKETVIKVLLTITAPLWFFPYMFYQIADDVYEEHFRK